MKNVKENIDKVIDITKKVIHSVVEVVKKVYKCRIAFNIGVKVYNKAYAIYSLFPKYDKITGIDTDKLVKTHMNKYSEQ